MSEATLEQAICQYLYYSGWFVFKVKDQTAFREGAHRKPLPFQINGVADLFAIKNGDSLWIEVKTKTGVQSKVQKEFQKNIQMQKGIYILVRSLDELKEKISSFALSLLTI